LSQPLCLRIRSSIVIDKIPVWLLAPGFWR
jgi:hypothetical protein